MLAPIMLRKGKAIMIMVIRQKKNYRLDYTIDVLVRESNIYNMYILVPIFYLVPATKRTGLVGWSHQGVKVLTDPHMKQTALKYVENSIHLPLYRHLCDPVC